MSDTIDYYFTSISPFAYLGHKKMVEVAKNHGKSINFKPFDLFGVWKVSGAVPPGQRPLVRQRYRKIEIQRIAVMRDTHMNQSPKFFPTDQTQADLCIAALLLDGQDASQFSFEVGRAVWERDLQIADESVLSSLLTECGKDAAAIIELSKTDDAARMREKNTQDAIVADAIGSPAYVYNGEVFWGQERLEHLEQMITSGRHAFSSDI